MILKLIRQRILELQAKYNGNWVQTPTRLQMEFTECGATSLGIILQYYGCYVPLTQLRESCGVSRDGSDAANLVLAASKYGLKAKGFKKGIKALEKIKPPTILFWEFNHFLILRRRSVLGLVRDASLRSVSRLSIRSFAARFCSRARWSSRFRCPTSSPDISTLSFAIRRSS